MSENHSDHSRRFYLLLFLALLVIEIFIGAFVRDRIIRPYVGDILVVILLYAFLRVFIPSGFPLLSLSVLFFAVLVEILQYFHFGKLLGLEHYRIVMIILGSTFDIKDIFCYVVGYLIIRVTRL